MKQNKIFLKLLIDKDLSKTEIAQKVGVSWQTVYYWSIGRNKPSIEKALALSELLGVTVEQLYRMLMKSEN